MKEKSVIMNEQAMQRAVIRIAHEIIEHNRDGGELVMAGILRRGLTLAWRIAGQIHQITGKRPPVGRLDITFYRDDLQKLSDQPCLNHTDMPCCVMDKHIVLVDDVLYTGRTVRAAMEALIALGRPKSIQLAILVDRGHRELPIKADYVGKNIPTAEGEMIAVRVAEYDGINDVALMEGEQREGK